jgi:hypothetical protein
MPSRAAFANLTVITVIAYVATPSVRSTGGMPAVDQSSAQTVAA